MLTLSDLLDGRLESSTFGQSFLIWRSHSYSRRFRFRNRACFEASSMDPRRLGERQQSHLTHFVRRLRTSTSTFLLRFFSSLFRTRFSPFSIANLLASEQHGTSRFSSRLPLRRRPSLFFSYLFSPLRIHASSLFSIKSWTFDQRS